MNWVIGKLLCLSVMTDRLQFLSAKIGLRNYPKSRVHKLKTFGSSQLQCFVKRDDELGSGVGGAKVRKYLSLIPHLVQKKVKKVIVIGGAYSNNVVALTQQLIENEIEPVLFLLRSHGAKVSGNYLLTLLLAQNNIHWIVREQWQDIETLVNQYAKENLNVPYEVIPEGAFMHQAFPGALTLGLDIANNEKEYDLNFDHVFVEAGSGLMAITTILALAYIKPSIKIHVLLLADNEAQFLVNLEKFQLLFDEIIGEKTSFSNNFTLHTPQVTPKSFGATNQMIFENIASIAKNEGFFTDPIYSSKLFIEAQNIMESSELQGNAVIIHSGGANTLAGFQDQLLKTLLN